LPESKLEGTHFNNARSFSVNNDLSNFSKAAKNCFSYSAFGNKNGFTLKAELQKLIETNAIDKVLKRFLEAAKENHLDCAHELTLLSARFTNLNAEIRQGVLTKADERIERNQINAALTELMNRLEI
jgi:Effector-associated domain 11